MFALFLACSSPTTSIPAPAPPVPSDTATMSDDLVDVAPDGLEASTFGPRPDTATAVVREARAR